jgi:HD-GYP domain-containing protein (c-di-GMP phosphodiesterase class II)
MGEPEPLVERGDVVGKLDRREPVPVETSSSSERAWAAHPTLSRFLRLAIFLLPLGCAFAATTIARGLLPDATETTLVSWIGLLALGVAVALGAERIARRLLPLATLLKLSMLFPTRAPSRFRVARKAGSVHQLEHLRAGHADQDVGRAAEAILTLVAALGAHDRRTRGHAERVRVFTDMIADQLELPVHDRYRLRWSALLHDIGKLSIDPSILNKTEPLTPEEWNALAQHPVEGLRMVEPLAGWLGPWADAIAHHHERYDGTGYPSGLAADEINLGARIVSVADVYDTMTSARSYKRPKATRAAREELVWCAGSQLDPDVVRAFLAISLPRLLWATGPATLLMHLPFLARLRSVGRLGLTSAGRAVTASAAAGVVAVALLAPSAAVPAERVSTDVVRADGVGRTDHRLKGDDRQEPEHEKDRDGGRDRGEEDGENEPPDPEVAPVDSGSQDDGDGGGGDPSPEPEPKPEPKPEPEPEEIVGTAVPDVIGMREADATAALENAGFVVRVLRRWDEDKSLKNTVGAQSKPAGDVLAEGTTITITVFKWRNKN